MIQLTQSLYLLSICWNQGQHCVVMALACCQMGYFQEFKCHLDLRERASIYWSIVRMFHDRYDSLSNSVTQIRKCLISCICFFCQMYSVMGGFSGNSRMSLVLEYLCGNSLIKFLDVVKIWVTFPHEQCLVSLQSWKVLQFISFVKGRRNRFMKFYLSMQSFLSTKYSYLKSKMLL